MKLFLAGNTQGKPFFLHPANLILGHNILLTWNESYGKIGINEIVEVKKNYGIILCRRYFRNGFAIKAC